LMATSELARFDMTAKLKLISHKLCPYVQRAVIALTEKGVPFERIDIDLANKPDWFLSISPLGKTPVLVVDGDHAIFESAVILEYLEETEAKPLHPSDPLRRAEHRAWIEFGAFCAAGDARCGNAVVRRRSILAGGCGVRAGVSLFRCVRHDRRFRNFARQAEARALAQQPRRTAVGAIGRERGLSRIAARFSRQAPLVAVAIADKDGGLERGPEEMLTAYTL
jgi:glutathione S-transferase